MRKKLVSVIAPMFNEGLLVFEYCNTTLSVFNKIEDKYDLELILVNDGSKDDTLDKMFKMHEKDSKRISIINLTRNFGLEGAVSAGLKVASGDAVVVMDADLQDPPSLIPEMLKKWEQGADVIIASRYKRSNDNFLKKFTAKIYYKLLDSLSGKLVLEKSAANFRLLSRKALLKLLELPEVNTVFRVTVPFIGMKCDKVEYDRDKRFAGKTKYNFKSMLRYALDSITGISIDPLRKLVYTIPLAGLATIISLVGLIVSENNWKIGFMICLLISLFFTILFASLVIIGEYIAQIMTEVKGRPTSLIYDYLLCDNAKERKNVL